MAIELRLVLLAMELALLDLVLDLVVDMDFHQADAKAKDERKPNAKIMIITKYHKSVPIIPNRFLPDGIDWILCPVRKV